jgi:hypothetical protein
LTLLILTLKLLKNAANSSSSRDDSPTTDSLSRSLPTSEVNVKAAEAEQQKGDKKVEYVAKTQAKEGEPLPELILVNVISQSMVFCGKIVSANNICLLGQEYTEPSRHQRAWVGTIERMPFDNVLFLFRYHVSQAGDWPVRTCVY